MGLSCYCGDEFDWYYYPPNDLCVLGTRRARRCCSCRARIGPQDQCAVFTRTREPNNDVEVRIYGDGPEAVPLAHEARLCRFRIALDEGRSVIVANTFSQRWEMRAYHNEAAARGIPCLTVTATGAWQNVHGVPEEAIRAMRERWEE